MFSDFEHLKQIITVRKRFSGNKFAAYIYIYTGNGLVTPLLHKEQIY